MFEKLKNLLQQKFKRKKSLAIKLNIYKEKLE